MNKILMFWAFLFTFVILPNTIQAHEAYTVVKDGTLTFYYDNNKSIRDGNVYDIATEYAGEGNFPAWQGTEITKAVFDQSFANYSPTSTARWFHSCSKLSEIESISCLHTDNVTSMAGMFYECSSLSKIDLSGFNTSNVTNMFCMFYNCQKLETIDLGNFDTGNVTTMVAMFYGCTNISEINLSSFNTKNVIDMQYMFFNCSKLLSIDVTSFDTSKVTNMEAMFARCRSIKTLDLSSFKTSNVTNIQLMFSDCTSLETIYASDGWSIEKITMGYWVFDNCPNLRGSEGTTYVNSLITNYLYAKVDEYISPGYFTYKSATSVNHIKVNKDGKSDYYYSIGGRRNVLPYKGINISKDKKFIVK